MQTANKHFQPAPSVLLAFHVRLTHTIQSFSLFFPFALIGIDIGNNFSRRRIITQVARYPENLADNRETRPASAPNQPWRFLAFFSRNLHPCLSCITDNDNTGSLTDTLILLLWF
jgi:hypothetical protein